ncbi:signal peptidase [Parapedobacter defluvii]|uniref:signal peptidase n=1 Tax=Parapedobacter defluvii TaxID=2045106 RepID=UPI0033428DBE
MNKYLQRGILSALLGIALCMLGLFLMGRELSVYKWVLVSGVIVFGIGFLTILYGLIRKIERRSILDERKERQQNNE